MSNTRIWIVEIFWWIVGMVLAGCLIYPYYKEAITNLPFLVPNVIITLLMVQCIRYIFFLRESYLSRSIVSMIPLVFVSIPIIFYTIRHYSFTMLFFETNSWVHNFSYILNANEKMDLSGYIMTQFRIISVSTIVLAIIMSFRMMVGIWRKLNNRPLV